MDKRESMWDVYLRKGMSRRSFVKACVALTSLMGLSTDQVSRVVEAAEKKPLPVVVWIHGHECTGCDESFIRSGAPLASDLILSQISLEYDHLLAAASGEPFEAHLEETINKYKGQYILCVEGAVCTKDNGVYCMSGGKPFIETLQHAAHNAAAVIAYGTCAVSGGIQGEYSGSRFRYLNAVKLRLTGGKKKITAMPEYFSAVRSNGTSPNLLLIGTATLLPVLSPHTRWRMSQLALRSSYNQANSFIFTNNLPFLVVFVVPI